MTCILRGLETLSNSRSFRTGRNRKKNFRVVLAEYDRQIGRLLREIKNMNLENNTIVIFTSDNGPAPVSREAGPVI